MKIVHTRYEVFERAHYVTYRITDEYLEAIQDVRDRHGIDFARHLNRYAIPKTKPGWKFRRRSR